MRRFPSATVCGPMNRRTWSRRHRILRRLQQENLRDTAADFRGAVGILAIAPEDWRTPGVGRFAGAGIPTLDCTIGLVDASWTSGCGPRPATAFIANLLQV